jgi:hypothetical protein
MSISDTQCVYDWTQDIVRGDDGEWIFWPEPSGAAYPAHLLRTIAKHLEELNNP